jgi:hypothetical protein
VAGTLALTSDEHIRALRGYQEDKFIALNRYHLSVTIDAPDRLEGTQKMRQVGTRKEATVQPIPSAEALVAGAQFSMSISQLAGGSTFVPKGLYRFHTHEDAQDKAASWLAAGMARMALDRKHE